MELLALILIWPFLILALGLTVIAFGDWGGSFWLFGGWLAWPVGIILFFVFLSKLRHARDSGSPAKQLATIRLWAITLSITLLLPTFARYVVDSVGYSLGSIITVLILGFGLIVAGMFMQNRRALMYSNIAGGGLTVFYAYSHLWELSELARIAVAAVALVMAVVIAVVKLKDKLS